MESNATFFRDGKEIKRQKCLVYTRCMGYLAPYARYNPGKKSEFFGRKYFTEEAANNSTVNLITANQEFVKAYSQTAIVISEKKSILPTLNRK